MLFLQRDFSVNVNGLVRLVDSRYFWTVLLKGMTILLGYHYSWELVIYIFLII